MTQSGVTPTRSTWLAPLPVTSPTLKSPLLDSDIQAEVIHAQQVKGWTSRLHNVFFVFLQSGEDLCTDNTDTYCAEITSAPIILPSIR